MRTCAWCGWRDPIGLTAYDGRDVATCGVCLDPPEVSEVVERSIAKNNTVAQRILSHLRANEATLSQLADATQAPPIQIAHACSKLARLGQVAYREIVGRGYGGRTRVYRREA